MSTVSALHRLADPLTSGLTYRRYVHLLLGAVVLVPYLALVWLFADSVTGPGTDPLIMVALIAPATAGAVRGRGLRVGLHRPAPPTLMASEVERLVGPGRGDDVPSGAPATEVIQRGELPGQLKRIQIGRRRGGDQADAFGLRGCSTLSR